MTATSEAYMPPSGDRLSLPPEANVSELSVISMPQIATDPQFSGDNRAYRWNRNNYSKRRRKIDIWSLNI